jgi:hypothetical protein
MIVARNHEMDLVAVATHPTSTSRLSVSLYYQGNFQTTLTHKIIGELNTLRFSGSYLLGLIQESAWKKSVVVWSVTRGVVVQTFSEDVEILAMTTLSSSSSSPIVFLLIRNSPKLYIYEYTIKEGSSTLSLIRKIKVGKVTQEGSSGYDLEANNTLLAVRQGSDVKLIERLTGKKSDKITVDGTNSMNHDIPSGTLSLNESHLAVCTHNTVQVFEGEKSLMEVISSNVPTNVKLHGNYLLVDSLIYKVSASKSAVPVSTMKCEVATTVIIDFFNDEELQVIFQGSKGEVEVHRMPFVLDGKEVATLSIPKKEDILGMPLESTTIDSKPLKTKTKALGPGQAGSESLVVSDRPTKKPRKAGEDEMKIDDLTIAERLKRLQEVLEEEDDAEDLKVRPKQATTESLGHLLQQALSSSDEALLEVALDVRDTAKIRQHSIDGLTVEQASLFLQKLTTRLVKRPARAASLVPWIQLLLLSGKIQSSDTLIPLNNLVQERIEVFPQLLQLEGRLSMMVHFS